MRRSVGVKMTADGEEIVWCPASDFFGSDAGLNEVRNRFQSVTANGLMVVRWVMPYQRDATITLENLGPVPDWGFIRIEGRGVWVGDTLSLFNPVATWHGEGDEKIRGDDGKRRIGTGTEDYYDYFIQNPFANQVHFGRDLTRDHNVLVRNRSLDTIPFGVSFRLDWELISWKPTTLVYAATAHWHAFSGATADIAPQPTEAAAPIPTPPNSP